MFRRTHPTASFANTNPLLAMFSSTRKNASSSNVWCTFVSSSQKSKVIVQQQTNSSSNNLKLPAIGASLFQSQRNVQFRKTSEMYNAINGKKEEREHWVTKSTADYAERLKVAAKAGIQTKAKPFVTTLLYESESKTSPKSPDYDKSLDQKQQKVGDGSVNTTTGSTETKPEQTEYDETRVNKHKEEFEKQSYEHWERIRTFDAARSGRFKTYFAEHGWGFFTFYCMLWMISFVAIYLGLKLKILDYRGMFEYIFIIAFGQIERESFFAKMEDVNPMYFDLAFTFGLNELIDIVRLPAAVLWFLALKHWWTRQPGKTMMRDFSPEKAVDFTIKARDGVRRRMMKGSGGTLSSAARTPTERMP